ncbi:alpha/beta fold hydrolase [Brevundimonas goettingensis]|uniref:Alpha/beta hydrolase n=1 Tax=Brevundimonas goettingensis TaxID=2774190 RepID=A0A975BZF0_9CAUL|nr:alpha/beta hydrolase [Brevundimonas goettingensis]QTC89909.1 alpha/beta hydrolase [Brevundimonas goettingensis]
MFRTLRTLVAAALIALGGLTAASATAQTPAAPARKTVVLVHGAWADGGSWNRVVPYLLAAGLNVVAVQNPLASLEGDVANTTRVINDQAGDVILVGHSYGGVVITEAGNNPKVKALVYVAAFAPKPGQSVNAILSAFPPPAWFASLHADAGGYVTWPLSTWKTEFATGLPDDEQTVLHASQHPTFHGVNDNAIGDTAAWSSRPVTSVVSQQDHIIPAPLQMLFAQQMHSTVVPVEAGHLAMLIAPEETAKAIIAAANSY